MEVLLPLLGDVMTEGTVTTWFQADGAHVRQGEPLYQVETDKVNLTVDAPESGVLERVAREGDTLPVGAVVGRLVAVAAASVPEPRAGGALAAAANVSLAAAAVANSETSAAAEDAFATTGSVGPDASSRPRGSSAGGVSGRETPAASVPTETVDVRATPAARALARRLGVDLRRIANSRRLREADVLAVSAPDRSRPLAGRRKVIAERMRTSLAQTAQLTVSMEVDLTEALRLREQLKQLVAEDQRPTITDVVVRAAVMALKDHPALNATLERGRLEVHPEVHVGIAVDADEGLVVPVVRDAHLLDLFSLSARTRYVSARARGNALHVDDVRGGTFTVTSLGPLGVDFFTPILNPPQVAILGIGRVFPRLVLQGGRVEERQMMYLNLSFDHQAVDGAPAARFLQTVKRFLELPAALVVQVGL
jgi:pyruvate dehydrogenase E2 component (dihydrolipoamide acetyltransferase)